MMRIIVVTLLLVSCYPAGVLAGDLPAYHAIDLGYAQGTGIGGGQQVGYGFFGFSFLWTGSPASQVLLTAPQWSLTRTYATDGLHQVGDGVVYGGTATHALLWSGSADSVVDLNPAGYFESHAFGDAGSQQVGYGFTTSTGPTSHALLWSGSATGYIDLSVPRSFGSYAIATDGIHQIGYASSATTFGYHAILWHGSANDYVDLNPTGFLYTYGNGVAGDQEVGYGWGGIYANDHALLWTGSSSSVVDLTPANFVWARATATNGHQQVGYGIAETGGGGPHALLWGGSATDVVDLNQYLPAGWNNVSASGIDAAGNVIGSALDPNSQSHAILWAIPEPGVLSLITVTTLALLRRDRRATVQETP